MYKRNNNLIIKHLNNEKAQRNKEYLPQNHDKCKTHIVLLCPSLQSLF